MNAGGRLVIESPIDAKAQTIIDFSQVLAAECTPLLKEEREQPPSLAQLLRGKKGVEVIGETGDAGEALRLIKELRPDLVLLDIAMSEMNEFEVLEKSTRQFPEVRIIVLTAGHNGEGVSRALHAGAAGYLPVSANSTELVDAIATVARGEIYVSREISKQTLVDGVTERDSLAKLTRRQREVLALIADGYTTREIARALNISVKTVETYRAQLMERLNIHDVAPLVRFAIRVGLIDVE